MRRVTHLASVTLAAALSLASSAALPLALALAGAGSAGCAGAQRHVAAMDEVERVREGAGAKQGAELAPEAYARAEQERRFSIAAHDAGDDVAATLHAQRALAAYDHALVIGRLARATGDLADAQKALGDVTTQAQAVEASRAQLERDAQELEGRLRATHARMMPAASEPAAGDREAARRVAARSMAVEARLLCDAAQLVAPDAASAAGLGDAQAELSKLDERLGGRRTAAAPDAPSSPTAPSSPIDDAARVRAHCLDVLTRARRATGDDADAADALLAELSASGGWAPSRDERGVVVTLHDAFQGPALSADAAGRLKELGRVAAAHAGFVLQVVVHDAVEPATGGNAGAGAADADAKRADAAAQALASGGATAGRLKTELAGARAPLVDPSDARARGRNERLDVVFIAAAR